MIATNFFKARANFKSLMDKAKNDSQIILITSSDGNVVMLSEEKYNNIVENIYILSNPRLIKSLEKSVEQIASGDVIEASINDLKTAEQ